MRLKPNQPAIDFTLEDSEGRPMSLSDFKGMKVLLSFYRDAGCPFCNMRIYEMTRYHRYYAQKGLAILAVFQSPKAAIQRYVGKRHQRPFPMLADPYREVYKLYGVESSVGRLMLGFFKVPRILKAFSKGYLPTLGAFKPLLPADFLIGPDFNIKQVFYSNDAAGHIPLAKIEDFITRN